ncbi:hypothetical protein HCN51_30210 [Nonomuraea sp. FMUSA5-5]|uniref:Uncharacterized protein n=1 Tax=Nonomuraea composti TaxID=2720023 RepID=A0ABX1BAW9_9ACTN|nr:hypothetical protein [Nonomuraea sp. FMUSA5-5]NJP93667.1 hypothetical protein [Nonomuraea sp. FMUSA5-5]
MDQAIAGFDGRDDLTSWMRLRPSSARLALPEGKQDPALDGVRELAERAQQSGNMDLAAETWRLIAESLAK